MIAPSLLTIAQPFKGILLDAYGVFWGGAALGLLPGAKEAMEKLVSQGKIVGILSNSTQLSPKEIDKIHKHGLELDKHFHFFITSGDIARSLFSEDKLPFPSPRKKFWIWGEKTLPQSSHYALFEDTSYTEAAHIEEADFIYVPVPQIHGQDQTDPALFHASVEKMGTTSLPMLCVNPDRFAHEGNPPRPVVRQGSIAALYEKIGGQVFYIGKPSAHGYQLAMQLFAEKGITNPSEVLMVGDTPETDIRGARNFGMASALTTQTGIMAERPFPPSDVPDFYIERLGDFPLHSNLASKAAILDLPLCRVLMEDEKNYPWLLLVPRRTGVSKLIDLKPQDQHQLFLELDLAQKVVWEIFHPHQLNVAALGNKTPQLHVHIIARNTNDPAWPGTVWDHPVRSPYSSLEKETILRTLETALAEKSEQLLGFRLCHTSENMYTRS